MKVKLFKSRVYLLFDRLPKIGENFFETGTRTSYHNRIFKCSDRTEGFIFSGDFDKNTSINHPSPDQCKPIIFSFKYKL